MPGSNTLSLLRTGVIVLTLGTALVPQVPQGLPSGLSGAAGTPTAAPVPAPQDFDRQTERTDKRNVTQKREKT